MKFLFALNTTNVIATFFLAIFVYNVLLAIYRLFFHPLAKFPGPVLARATYFYMFYHDVIRHGYMFVGHIKELHEIYGPVVRVSPNEVHVSDIDFSLSVRQKKIWKPPGWNTQIQRSMLGAVTHERHRMLRSAVNPFFSKRNILANEPFIKERLNRFFERLKELHEKDQVFRMEVAANALTMDIICKFAFGLDFGHLDCSDFNVAWKEAFLAGLASINTFALLPWLPRVMRNLPRPILKRLVRRHAPVLKWEATIAEKVNEFLAANAEGKRREGTIFQAILDSDLPPDEKDAARLRQEGALVVGAGSETTARALAVNSFFIFRDRAIVQRLRDEIRTLTLQKDGFYLLNDLEQLPFLSACIQESLRMQTSGAARKQRQYPEPLEVQGWVIPPLHTFSDNSHDRMLNPKVFMEPYEYIPERWIDNQKYDIALQQKYFFPFERGTRNCIGQNLSLAEIYLSIAHMVMRFDLELYDTTYEKDIHVVREFFVGVANPESKGIRLKVTKILDN